MGRKNREEKRNEQNLGNSENTASILSGTRGIWQSGAVCQLITHEPQPVLPPGTAVVPVEQAQGSAGDVGAAVLAGDGKNLQEELTASRWARRSHR